MFIIFGIIATVLTLLIVVGLHEIGHLIAARYFGVKVRRISIGFGKPLFISKKNNIEWVWSLWPFGGYVQLLNTRIEKVPEEEQHYSFDKKPIYVRFIILISGILFNLVVAWLCFVLIFLIGFKQYPAIIKTVLPNSVTAAANLKAGDRIIALNNKPTLSIKTLAIRLINNIGKEDVPVTIKRNSQTFTTSLNLKKWHYVKSENALFEGIGIEFHGTKDFQEKVPGVGIFQSFKYAFISVYELTMFFFIVLKQIFTKTLPFAVLLGPLGIFDVIAKSFLQGLTAFLYLLGTLNISVAVINILPLPGLDGGLILYLFLEKLRGKPLSVAMEILLYRLTFIAFVLILIQLVLNDIRNYIH